MANSMLFNSGSSMRATLLGTNPNPEINFTGKTIYFNEDATNKYDYLYLVYTNYGGANYNMDTMFTIIEPTDSHAKCFGISNSYQTILARKFSYSKSSLSSAYIGSCYTSDGAKKEDWIIPLYIYGVKGKISGLK